MPSNFVPSVATSRPSTVPETVILPVMSTPDDVVSSLFVLPLYKETPPAAPAYTLVPEIKEVPVWPMSIVLPLFHSSSVLI